MAIGYAKRGPTVSGKVLESNSSSTLITNGNSFTGTWEDVSGYNSMTVAVKTDQNGYYTVQFSPDGTNADSTLTRYYTTSLIEPPHRFTITRKYMRVVFTNNSGSDQTYFRLQTIAGEKAEMNIPCDAVMAQDYDAFSVRPTDFTQEVALGLRQGASTWNKFGYNDDIDTATDPEVIAAFGGTFQYLTAGETINIVSASTDDDGSPAGTGANSVVIYGVDENWESQTEVVVLNGTTTVTTSSQWIGINRVAIYLAGSGKTNAGLITITASSSGYTMATMPAGQGTTQQLIFYVPLSHQFLATWLRFNSIKLSGGAGNPEVQIKGWVFSAVSNAEYEVFRETLDTASTTIADLRPPEPFIVGEKSILWFTAETDKDNTAVRGRLSGKLFRDVDA